MIRRFLWTVATGVAIAAGASVARAQDTAAVFLRARQLVVNGNGAAGRVLVDSVIAATTPDTPAYAEALYWRAALAVTSADAERDYRRIVVEYPLSPRSADALLQLAQLEAARGDRASASAHLARFLAENPTSVNRGRADLQLVRLLFDQNDLARGCTALRQALAEVPDAAVETRNQLTYYSPRCAAADTGPGGRVSTTPGSAAAGASPPRPVEAPAAVPEERADSPVKSSASSARYTLQVAAYKSKSEAETLVKKLEARKLEARVVGSAKLFRVRVGRYKTRAEALSAQKTLKSRKIDAFITEIGAGDR